MVAVSSSSPARSSWRVSRSNFDLRGAVGRQEGLLAVEDLRVRAPGEIDALDRAGSQVQLDAPQQGRVRVGLEVGVDEIRDLARMKYALKSLRDFEEGCLTRRARRIRRRQLS
jgi:hypothetical protein